MPETKPLVLINGRIQGIPPGYILDIGDVNVDNLNNITGVFNFQKSSVTGFTITIDPSGAGSQNWAAGTTSVSYSQTQASSGAGAAWSIRAQQGFAGFVGGTLTIGGGDGGTPGTNLAGGTDVQLGTLVATIGAKLRVLNSGTSQVEIYTNGANTFIDHPDAATQFTIRALANALQFTSSTSQVGFTSAGTQAFASSTAGLVVNWSTSTGLARQDGMNATGSVTYTHGAAVTSVNWVQAQHVSAAGNPMVVRAQQGFAGFVGGRLTLSGGVGGTPGTNLAGEIFFDLGTQVAGASTWARFIDATTPAGFLSIRGQSTTAAITSTAGLDISNTTGDLSIFVVNAGGGRMFFTSPHASQTFVWRGVSNGLVRTDAYVPTGATTETWAEAVTSLTFTQTKRAGTGANAGAAWTIAAQDGQNVAAGTNNSGGPLRLKSGAVGTGGTGGSNGDVELYNGANVSLRIQQSSSSLVAYWSDNSATARVDGFDATGQCAVEYQETVSAVVHTWLTDDAAAGGAWSLTGQQGFDGFAGGAINITSGAAGSTGTRSVGGKMTLSAGAAGGNSGAGAVGGLLELRGGDGSSAIGGGIDLYTGAGADFGFINFNIGQTAGHSLAAYLTKSNALITDALHLGITSDHNFIIICDQTAAASATGKLVAIIAQTTTGTTSTGGRVILNAGGGTTSGGDISIESGGGITNGNGGHISLRTGDGAGSGLDGNVTIFSASGSYGGGERVIFIKNRTTAPSSDPTDGGILYVEAGALKFRGSGGTTTTVAPA